MIEYLELLWKRLTCDHEYEIAYVESDKDSDNKTYHFICIHCGKTKIE